MLDGLNPLFIDSSGLTQAAVQCFDRIITGKIKCSKLQQQYCQLKAEDQC